MKKTSLMLWLIVPGTLLTGLVLSVLLHFDLEIPLLNFVNGLQNLGFWAPVIFIVLDMLFVVFLLPSVLLTLSAGFLFGTLIGTAIIVIATTIGAAIAFLISRYLFSQTVKDYLHNHKKLQVINEEFVTVGWKFVLLTRLVPFFPLKLSNYLFGAAPFSFSDFIFGTVIGIIPNTVFIVYAGSLANDIFRLIEGDLMATKEILFFYALTLLFLLVTVVYINRISKKALIRYESRRRENKGKEHIP